jgi:hypothetical protein
MYRTAHWPVRIQSVIGSQCAEWTVCSLNPHAGGFAVVYRKDCRWPAKTETRSLLCYIWQICHVLQQYVNYFCGPGRSVGIATDFGLDGPGSNPGRDEIFPPVQTDPAAHPASCEKGNGYFPGIKCGRGVLLTTHPLLVPRSWKSRAITLPPLWATPGL